MEIKSLYIFTIFCANWNFIRGCHRDDKQVGVCLHIYLERDFLSLEKIIYPSEDNHRHRRFYTHRKHNKLKSEGEGNAPGEYGVGEFGHRDWIEGPELEDHCKRLKEVLKCFEQVLIDCDSGFNFFRYRHLLYALSKTHRFLCATPQTRRDRFLRLLKTIKCVEEARLKEVSCHRHNVTSVVWNKILRAEVGKEICDSLSTQRACLLENGYISQHCRDPEREELYSDLSSYFLSIWCQYPIHPKLLNMTMFSSAKGLRPNSSTTFAFLVCFIFLVYKPS